jgi:DNA-binding CsgD family transcriptional regulator
MHNPLTPNEVALFRALVKSAAIVLLMIRLDRSAGARELAVILDLDEHTVSKHLRALAQLNLVARTSRFGGYILLGGSQLILGNETNVKNLQSDPIIITRDTDIKNDSVVIIKSAPTVKNLQCGADLSPIEQALKEAGISNPKRQALANRPDITPEAIRAWEANLKHEKGKRYTAGLLIHMLESGEPAPPVNQNGHHLKCICEDCQRINYREWLYLGYPRLEDDEEDEYFEYNDEDGEEGDS